MTTVFITLQNSYRYDISVHKPAAVADELLAGTHTEWSSSSSNYQIIQSGPEKRDSCCA
jgi:hypothetical protein